MLGSMTNIYQGYGQDDAPTAPHTVPQAGHGGSGGSGPGGSDPGGSGSGGSGSGGSGSGGGRRRRWAAVVAVTAGVVGGGAFAAAEAATGSPAGPAALTASQASTTTSTSTSAQAATSTQAKKAALRRDRLARLRRLGGMYGQATFETKTGSRTLAFERGTIVSVSGDEVVVRAHNGMTEAWTLTSKSVVRENGKAATDGALSAGELVFTGGPVAGGAHDIRVIVIRKAASSGTA
jgi:hypothetical protein